MDTSIPIHTFVDSVNSDEAVRNGSVDVKTILTIIAGIVMLSAGVAQGDSNIFHSSFADSITGFSGLGGSFERSETVWDDHPYTAESRQNSIWHERLLRQTAQTGTNPLNGAVMMRRWRDTGIRFTNSHWSDRPQLLNRAVAKDGNSGDLEYSDYSKIPHLVSGLESHYRSSNGGWFGLTTIAENFGTVPRNGETFSVELGQLDGDSTAETGLATDGGFVSHEFDGVVDIPLMPEPSSLALFVFGAVAIIGCRYWRDKRRATAFADVGHHAQLGRTSSVRDRRSRTKPSRG